MKFPLGAQSVHYHSRCPKSITWFLFPAPSWLARNPHQLSNNRFNSRQNSTTRNNTRSHGLYLLLYLYYMWALSKTVDGSFKPWKKNAYGKCR